MLELKTYSMHELYEILHCNNRNSLKKKLNGYGVSFTDEGRGDAAVFHLHSFKSYFKIYAITELGISAQTDFRKMLYLYFEFFNNDEFLALPDESKESYLRNINHDVTRQSIAHYIAHLDRKNYIHCNSGNFVYYFAYKNKQIFTDKESYNRAWHEYFELKKNDADSFCAIRRMINTYGGVARKQQIPDINGIYLKEIDYMLSLIQRDIEQELDKFEAVNG